jgi:hypothetical protein
MGILPSGVSRRAKIVMKIVTKIAMKMIAGGRVASTANVVGPTPGAVRVE